MEQKHFVGLTEQEILESRSKYGENLLTPPKETPWWKLYLEKFGDPIIIILLVATAISLVFGIIHGDFTESIGIIFAVLIATGVGFWQEYDAKKKFDAMKSDKDYEHVKVRRNGTVLEITKDQLVVGDIVILAAGDEIPADIELFEAIEMKVSEASMTGESVAVSKYPCQGFKGSGFAPNLLLRGTTIEQGLGEGIVLKVGDSTEIGKTTRQASEETNNKTPLEEQLDGLAAKINVAAFTIATIMFIILNIVHWMDNDFSWTWDTLLTEVRFLMGAVVVIIVAVPEGLPLSVTLALAFSMKTMAKENNLVKKMHACETIGAVNVIFSDKTGTLTQNSMTVVEADIKPENKELLNVIGALNSTANWSHDSQVLGNPTEGAILKFIGHKQTEQLRSEYHIVSCIPFSSLYKYMVTYIEKRSDGSKLMMIKGAPEVIAKLINKDDYLVEVSNQQARGRRAISAAIIHGLTFEELKVALDNGETLKDNDYIGTWFIEDPVRVDVPHAIGQCYRAGIDVVMMTGDNLKTGSEIARQAGFKDIWAIEAKDFYEAIKTGYATRKFPNVIARCTPTNKLNILKWAQEKGYICAMTGDGVNDSPSLNYADVGIAMGSGTSVAKEAADIILLDDAFPSIVTGVKWGRSLFKNIKNFLYMQLSINVSACLIAVFGPIVGVAMPFTVTQFLWINLVMDSLAAIALASEPADENVLSEKPRDRKEFIINKSLAKAILGFGGLIWLLCTLVLWGMKHNVACLSHINLTIFFAAYMVLNWWNLFNARVIGKNKSIFDGLGQNLKFVGVALGILFVTIVIVQIGGEAFQTVPLSWQTWGYIILLTSPVVIVRELWYRLISRK
ncbi:calcium-translocating P-type ATPase, PMCA-type [Bacteroides fragilis]|uniref:calcium-translocating P-type ATPase, PMCA-type n=1 Tax=Bacteroides fragilis TaxID=817 RepID=UPI00202F02BA|nr:calcium-translocating P-type ATPase, PMCA-type [Bacteroides fragilis]MCM0236672.1 calcium-translocating P-type ATPase, PMCA-type [Bacteroides fragilis]